MSAPILPLAGVTAMMDILIPAIAGGGLNSHVGIFVNDFVPTATSVLTDFVAATAAGLTPKPLPAATNAGLDPSGRDTWNFATANFTATGAGLPVVGFGYFVYFVDPVTGLPALLWFQRWDTAFAWFAAGQNYPLNLTFGGKQS